MRAIRFERHGGPEVLEIVELATPEPQPHEVLLEVEAAGVNFSDVGRRRGIHIVETPLPFVPGSEVVGRVCAVGSKVESWSVGDRVAGVTKSRSGGYAEFCAIDASLIARVGERLDARLAAAIPNQGGTALHLLETMARLKLGDAVAVTAAAGGVGGLAVQLARHLGAGRIVALTGSRHKLAHARSLGADEAIDSSSPSLAEELRQATDGRGFDVILDSVGGELASTLFDSLAPFGRFVTFGAASGRPFTMPTTAMMKRSVTVGGFHLDSVMGMRGWLSATLDRLYSLVDDGVLVPHIGLELPLERAARGTPPWRVARRLARSCFPFDTAKPRSSMVGKRNLLRVLRI